MKIVVFAERLSYQLCKTIAETDRAVAGLEWLIAGAAAPAGRDTGGDAPGAEYRAARVAARPNVTLEAPGEALAARIAEFAPELGLSLDGPPPGAALAALPRNGTLRLHRGSWPDYAGEAPLFWMLSNGEPELACTLVRLAPAGGAGAALAEARLPCPRYATLAGLELMVDEAGVGLVAATLARLAAGAAEERPPAAPRRVNPAPTRAQREALDRRLAAAQPGGGSWLRRAAKQGYLAARLALGRVTAALARRPAVAVLTYHRVNDDLRDNVTVGIAQFDRQMALLRRHCDIVSIEDVVAGALPPRARRPIVCVTFDDGYRDNFTNALPILLKHEVPAAFFVSTGFIGTPRAFPHDASKGIDGLPNLRWEELRAMRRHGQTIGSHTVNHIDCAKADAATLARELAQSMAALRDELGVERPIFAYPFGRPENFTPAALRQVKEAGYAGCLSSFGGFNRGAIDPFAVRRGGVNWPFTELGFLCRIWGQA